jgi:hypothetical protein
MGALEARRVAVSPSLRRKRKPSEIAYDRARRAAKIAMRKMFKQVGVWGILGILGELVVSERERRYRANPDDFEIDNLRYEEALAHELSLSLEVWRYWRQRRLKGE